MGVGESIFDSLMNSIWEKSKIGKGVQKLNKALGALEVSALEVTKLTIDDEYREALLGMGHDEGIFDEVLDGEDKIGHRVFRKKGEEEAESKEGGSLKELDDAEEIKDKIEGNKKEDHGNGGRSKDKEKNHVGRPKKELADKKKANTLDKNLESKRLTEFKGVDVKRKEDKQKSKSIATKPKKLEVMSDSKIEVDSSLKKEPLRDSNYKLERLENNQKWDELFERIDSTKTSLDDYFKQRLDNDAVMIKNIKEINERDEESAKRVDTQNTSDSDSSVLDLIPDVDVGGKKSPRIPGKGGKIAKFLGRAAKGLGKVALPLTAAMSLWEGVTSGSDDEAIKARTGKNEISTADRIKQGAAGALSGLVNWIPGLGDINASNTADFFEKSMNFVTGSGFNTDRELRESGVKNDKSLVETIASASPIGMEVNALRGEGIVKSVVGGSVSNNSDASNKSDVKGEVVGGSIKDSKSISSESNSQPISSIVNNTYNTTNVSQETQPRFRITDESTRALSVLGG